MAINTILLKGRGVRLEAKAAGAIRPGHLVRRNNAGSLIVNNVAARNVPRCVAVENDLEGRGIDDAYASGDFVQSETLRGGDWAYAFVPAAGAAIVIGDELEADATGCVIKRSAGTPIAVALDALDNSAGGAPARIRIEFI
jgi:hypothetical protein